MEENEILGLSDMIINTRRVKDWSDYVLVCEKLIKTEHNPNNGRDILVKELFYNVHDIPFPGEGYMYMDIDDEYVEQTLDEYIQQNVYNKYKDNEHVKIIKITQI